MNCRKRHPGKGRTPEVLEEIRRIVSMWREYRERYVKLQELVSWARGVVEGLWERP